MSSGVPYETELKFTRMSPDVSILYYFSSNSNIILVEEEQTEIGSRKEMKICGHMVFSVKACCAHALWWNWPSTVCILLYHKRDPNNSNYIVPLVIIIMFMMISYYVCLYATDFIVTQSRKWTPNFGFIWKINKLHDLL